MEILAIIALLVMDALSSPSCANPPERACFEDGWEVHQPAGPIARVYREGEHVASYEEAGSFFGRKVRFWTAANPGSPIELSSSDGFAWLTRELGARKQLGKLGSIPCQ